MWKAFVALLLLVTISFPTCAFAAHVHEGVGGKGDDVIMQLHHMHTLMDHTLEMVLQGSNLVMLSRMHGSEPLARLSGEHGREMIAEGKATLKEVLAGKEMKAAHEQGLWNEPLMGYTHELGAELLAVMNDLEKMKPADVAAHQRQMVLNHALEMAAEGSNLVMLGKMKMGGSLDARAEAHGCKMIADARRLWRKAAGGAATGGAEEFVKHGEKVLTLLEKMSALQY